LQCTKSFFDHRSIAVVTYWEAKMFPDQVFIFRRCWAAECLHGSFPYKECRQ